MGKNAQNGLECALRQPSASYRLERGRLFEEGPETNGAYHPENDRAVGHLSDQFQREEVNRLNGLFPSLSLLVSNLVRNNSKKKGLLISEEAYNA